MMARVGPEQRRRIVPGSDGFRFIALGGRPGSFQHSHWTELGAVSHGSERASRWPAVLRWLDAFGLHELERRVLRSPRLQRMVLAAHARAIRRLREALGEMGPAQMAEVRQALVAFTRKPTMAKAETKTAAQGVVLAYKPAEKRPLPVRPAALKVSPRPRTAVAVAR